MGTHLVNHPVAELSVGQTAHAEHRITQDDLYAYAAASGNFNPVHLPSVDGDGDGEPEGIAPGLFVASVMGAVLGNQLPGPGTLYRRQTLEFHDRAHAGDELTCRVRITDVQGDGTVRLETEVYREPDQRLILSGEAVVTAPERKFDRDDIEVPGLLVQRHRHFEQLIARARAHGPVAVAVVCPEKPDALEGALEAARAGLVQPVLVGRAEAIRRAAEQVGAGIGDLEIVDVQGADSLVARAACRLVHDGRVAALMKGHLHTDDLLRAVLDKTVGLRAGRRLTHVFAMDVPGHPHPILVTDAAINIAPDLAAKVDIVQNAVDLAAAIGLDPLAAVLSAVETVNPAIQSSIDAALLSKMADRGQIRGGRVEGPLAMDNAVNLRAARTKGLASAVAGQANILVVPGIDAGNMLAKQLTFISHALGAGLALGARVPIVLTSRSDSVMSRVASCALAVLLQASSQGQASREPAE